MKEPMKNIAKGDALILKEQVDYQPGQVVSKTLAQNDAVSVTLFSFDKGEEISTHQSEGDAFVTCLDGVGRITIDGKDSILQEGESIVMPAGRGVLTGSPAAFTEKRGRWGQRPLCDLYFLLFRGGATPWNRRCFVFNVSRRRTVLAALGGPACAARHRRQPGSRTGSPGP